MISAGKILLQKRKNCQISAAELARRMGVGRNLICSWEKEKLVPRANSFLKAYVILQKIEKKLEEEKKNMIKIDELEEEFEMAK